MHVVKQWSVNNFPTKQMTFKTQQNLQDELEEELQTFTPDFVKAEVIRYAKKYGVTEDIDQGDGGLFYIAVISLAKRTFADSYKMISALN